MSPLVNVEVQGPIAWITIDSPPVNAINVALIDALSLALDGQAPPDVRAVVIRSVPGAHIWSAGHDVRELPTDGRDPLTYSDPLRRMVRRIETHPLPIIAMVEGSVWGGACELVLACDLVVASSQATFALTPAHIGVPYDVAGILNLMKVADLHFVKEMLFTARPTNASRMAAYGVVNAVVPVEELESTTAEFCTAIAAASPLVIRIMKEELRVLGNAHPITPEAFERIQSQRREVYDSHDYQEGIHAFLEKRRPEFHGT